MNKVKLLSIAVVVLLGLNIATLLIGSKHGPPHAEGPKQLVIDRLHLDEQQVTAYSKLIEEHQAAIKSKNDELLAARKALYADLAREGRPISDSLTLAIAVLQQDIEMIHYGHFADIRELCHPDQIAAFDLLLNDLAGLFNGPGRGPRKR